MARSVKVNYDFPFFLQLHHFYVTHRRQVRQHYRELTRKYLDFNDPSNAQAFLRQPQFEALEMYIFLKEFLENRPIYQLFRDWADRQGVFTDRSAVVTRKNSELDQLGLFDEVTAETFEQVYGEMQSYRRTYPNYIFALTMGTGKTILMATCIFYEFILANKYPTDARYCHNALVFAPDTTVLQALREIQTFDKSRVVPPEYVSWLDANVRFHFLDEAGMALSVLDHSRFNLIVSNTQKVVLKRQHKPHSPMDLLMSSGRPTFTSGTVYDQFGDLYDTSDLDTEQALTTNQRFQKLQRLTQLGIYVDEAHHAFGRQLAQDMGTGDARTSLRLTIDELAASLNKAGTHVVACYNYTGTPYVQNRILPEVVYAFGLKRAIDTNYLKQVHIHGYENARTTDFVNAAVDNFLQHVDISARHERLLPKMAFFATTIDELQIELRPAVERALATHGIGSESILVNVGDSKLTSNDDIREFNRLDTPESRKQFILLVNKGREGWNCRSLFGVALYRKPNSKIFVLQASMRCLRSIGATQQTGHVYLSSENVEILDNELQQNFRVSIDDIQKSGQQREVVKVHVKTPVEKIALTRVRRLFQVREKSLAPNLDLHLRDVETDRYRLIHTERASLDPTTRRTQTEDVSYIRERRRFSRLTLVAEVARYLNRSATEVDRILSSTAEGIETIVTSVNQFNEVLYDWVIPRLFRELYEFTDYKSEESYEVELVRVPAHGFYEVSASHDLIVRAQDAATYTDKSFHLDAYCFDSRPEQSLFWHLVQDGRVKKVYFTGMLTHGQSDFFVQYIDPDSHTIRTYYPDFLLQKEDGQYVIVEVKRDDQIDAPVVRAKQEFAEQIATASHMQYRILRGTDAMAGHYAAIFDDELHDAYLAEQVVTSNVLSHD